MINNSKGMKKFSSLSQTITGDAVTKNTDNKDVNKGSTKESDDDLFPNKQRNKKKENVDINELKSLDISFSGKVAHFPKSVEASKALTLFENVKINKSALWYFIIEKQDNQLQMLKYNSEVGVNLKAFVDNLKDYYISEFKKLGMDANFINSIESINVTGKDKFAIIENIPKIKINNKFLITKITEDLISLLKD